MQCSSDLPDAHCCRNNGNGSVGVFELMCNIQGCGNFGRLPRRLEQDSVGSGTGDLGTVNSNHMKLIEWLGLENTRDRSKQHPEKRVSPPCTQKFKYMKTDYKKMRKYLVFHGKFLAQEVKAQSMVWPVVNVWS